MPETLARLVDIGKSFSGVTVLNKVNMELLAGEVHVLAGENGAGKSTLIKILSGVHAEYEGRMEAFGKPVQYRTPLEASQAGISVIHQEMSLIPGMDVVDNIFLGRELRQSAWRYDRRAQERKTRELLSRLNLADLELGRPVEEFSMSVRQRVEIAKALAFDARIFIMDEPTSAIPESDVELLFSIIRQLRADGFGIIYITHKMEEIYAIGDRITILRNGDWVGTGTTAEIPEKELVRMMVGRELDRLFPHRRETVRDAVRLRVEDFSVRDAEVRDRMLVRNVSFEAREGEILGFSGLQGSGNSELLNGIFGSYGTLASGRVVLDGTPVGAGSPSGSIRRGLSFLTNDRKASGIVPDAGVADNINLASLRRISSRRGWRNARLEKEAAERQKTSLRIRLRALEQPISTLSGGNQQKALIGRWLETAPRVLLLDEPTRGIDVGAKYEIYDLMNDLTAAGMTILLITSELPELLAMADRILVMHRGAISGEFSREDATQEKIVQAAMGA
ncbi:MAG: sugar ABC transporter ATP-binding protein [Planctomycetota bacterium]|jgi:ABC-type sugar transport system ATPase subunit|nr:sugar ABC transporter ATP-binding protein [Planctomycetota bacterium]